MTSTPTIFNGHFVQWTIVKGCATDGEVCVEEPSLFHRLFEWDSVKIKFDPELDPLKGFKVIGQIFAYTISNKPGEEPNITPIPVASTITSLSITSSHPTNDYWVSKDPTLYGGVGFTTTDVPVDLSAGETFEAGVDGKTGYVYADVFDKSDFKFYPRNSVSMNELKELEVGRGEYFRTEPMYTDLKDPYGKPAPIYPIDMITTFVPDDRESVEITYTVSVTASNKKGEPFTLDNGTITILQSVEQDVDDYGDQLKGLLELCNFANPGDIDLDDFSQGYPYNYPYTLVTGFEGVDKKPKTRGDDDDNRPLQRGDVWYDPKSDKRYYWNTSDTADRLDVVERGSRYKNERAVETTYLPDLSCSDEVDRFPSGMTVTISSKDGKVQAAEVVETGKGYEDGDVVVVRSGNNDCLLRVVITRDSNWTEQFISHY
jgi:hypothetical protein